MSTYKIKKGDNLSTIAKKNGLTLQQLLQLNPQIKNPNRIFIGQHINLGKVGSTGSVTMGGKTYVMSKPFNGVTQQLSTYEDKPKSPVRKFNKVVTPTTPNTYDREQEVIASQGSLTPKTFLSLGANDKVEPRFVNAEDLKKKMFQSGYAPTQKEVKTAQQILKQEGLYLGKIDGIWGNKSKTALRQYQLNNAQQSNSQQDIPEFYEYLYKDGSENYPLSNSITTTWHLGKFLLGSESESTYANEGTKKQIAALALKHKPVYADDMLAKGKSVTYSIGNDNNGDYAWKSVNGGLKVHDSDRGIFDRISHNSGEHILGRYTVTLHPDGNMEITDTYDFNEGGTKYAEDIINNNSSATMYDYIRATVGKLNRPGFDIKWTVLPEEIESWKKEYEEKYNK